MTIQKHLFRGMSCKCLFRYVFILCSLLILKGCAGLQEFNDLAQRTGAGLNELAIASARSDIESGRYSGTVRVAIFEVLPDKRHTGVIPEAALEVIKEEFGNHPQFRVLSDTETKSLQKELIGSRGNTLSPTMINMRAKRLERTSGLNVDVLLIAGMKVESVVGISLKTGNLGKGAKVVTWGNYMAIGDPKTSRVEGEAINYIRFREGVVDAAETFHQDVLENLMLEKLKRKIASMGL